MNLSPYNSTVYHWLDADTGALTITKRMLFLLFFFTLQNALSCVNIYNFLTVCKFMTSTKIDGNEYSQGARMELVLHTWYPLSPIGVATAHYRRPIPKVDKTLIHLCQYSFEQQLLSHESKVNQCEGALIHFFSHSEFSK